MDQITPHDASGAMNRMRLDIRGAVQGVGFRPFVYRIAQELHVRGWITNTLYGVAIEAEGSHEDLKSFLLRIEGEKPPHASIQSLEHSMLDPVGYERFDIRTSDTTGEVSALVLPDIATCPACLADISDPANRRFRYPFTNCTHCGPRYSIIDALPYDRSNTTMHAFTMCDECSKEYNNPADRRFHAQPNACPVCGPHVELWNEAGQPVATHHEAVLAACDSVRKGEIVAVKGVGGFHLIVDAENDSAVQRLRERKRREEKPLALMFPSIEAAHSECIISSLEERLLRSPESPIVLLRRSNSRAIHSHISKSVAPGNPFLGIMLPYSPLHHLLLQELQRPIVATSGNLTDEPICTDEHEALARLSGIADWFLVHDRPIRRHVDDSIARVVLDRTMVMRRARGYAPLPIEIASGDEQRSFLAVGPHLKNTVALSKGKNVFISQHIGDLETAAASDAFKLVVTSLETLYATTPDEAIADQHPDYLSTQYACSLGIPVEHVQHHYAHIASCMAENQLSGNVLGVSWDGTGYGPDGTIWGGEFLRTTHASFERVATFRRFPLPGGDSAVKEPRRTALGILHELYGESLFESDNAPLLQHFSEREVTLLSQMLKKEINSPLTSSAGRLFDGVAALIGLRPIVTFEGQAAMELEFLASSESTDQAYPFSTIREDGSPLTFIDWAPMILAILDHVQSGVPASTIAVRFHNTLTNIILYIARQAGEERVVLSGGCFQNAYLLERIVLKLRAEGFSVYWHQRVPTNDGGIALGQVHAKIRTEKESLLARHEHTLSGATL